MHNLTCFAESSGVKRKQTLPTIRAYVKSIFWNSCGAVVSWLSLLHSSIQPSLNLSSPLVQILFAAYWRFAMVRISDNFSVWNKIFRQPTIPQKQFIIITFSNMLDLEYVKICFLYLLLFYIMYNVLLLIWFTHIHQPGQGICFCFPLKSF